MTRTESRKIGLRRALRSRAVVPALAVSVIGQVVVLLALVFDADSRPEPIPVGLNLSSVSVRHADGTLDEVGAGQPTLLLVFDPDCAHSRRVAPAWSSWLAGREARRLRVLAISLGPLAEAIDFANEHHWPVEVLSLEHPAREPDAAILTRRTPWLVALDQAGRVVTDGHGADLDEVARALGGGGAALW
ncbi:MAG: hypothetical protein F4Z31_05415 [Gemmatimonadetes bacterium]|nr:hypothetical protein [Gemmatimonadota bacterium]MYA41172.1 hypothetical protein [Gemmatimonadota bacterium]MYE94716.1 hypothetical protein [Gemmatimonadota bacterium]MYJ09017.1 hypothetical protein [Gemmatimonadota bacterium]